MARSRGQRDTRQVAATDRSPIARARRPVVVVGAVAFALAAAGPAGATAPTTLLRGILALPAAESFAAPGFHQVLIAGGRVPALVASASRFRLTLTLRDLGRPRRRCSIDHPLSGCATVDWADDPSRPKVPAGGVFSNRITLRLGQAVESLYLRRSGTLGRAPQCRSAARPSGVRV